MIWPFLSYVILTHETTTIEAGNSPTGQPVDPDFESLLYCTRGLCDAFHIKSLGFQVLTGTSDATDL